MDVAYTVGLVRGADEAISESESGVALLAASGHD